MISILEEETKDFASQMFSPGLLVIHNAAGCGQYDIAELTRGQQIVGPLLNVVDGHIKAWRDDAAFVQTSSEVDNNLARAMIVNDLELANVSVLHHHSQELDDHLRAGTQQHLTLTALLGVVDAFQGIGQYVHTHHGCKMKGDESSFSSRQKKNHKLQFHK